MWAGSTFNRVEEQWNRLLFGLLLCFALAGGIFIALGLLVGGEVFGFVVAGGGGGGVVFGDLLGLGDPGVVGLHDSYLYPVRCGILAADSLIWDRRLA